MKRLNLLLKPERRNKCRVAAVACPHTRSVGGCAPRVALRRSERSERGPIIEFIVSRFSRFTFTTTNKLIFYCRWVCFQKLRKMIFFYKSFQARTMACSPPALTHGVYAHPTGAAAPAQDASAAYAGRCNASQCAPARAFPAYSIGCHSWHTRVCLLQMGTSQSAAGHMPAERRNQCRARLRCAPRGDTWRSSLRWSVFHVRAVGLWGSCGQFYHPGCLG